MLSPADTRNSPESPTVCTPSPSITCSTSSDSGWVCTSCPLVGLITTSPTVIGAPGKRSVVTPHLIDPQVKVSVGRSCCVLCVLIVCSYSCAPKVTALNFSVCSRIARSEEHTSELQSRFDLVCRLLLEK